MTQTGTEQKRSNRRARTGVPDPQGDVGVSGAGHDQGRWTGNEPGPAAHDSGLVVAVWLLAALIAEVEVLWWVLARISEH